MTSKFGWKKFARMKLIADNPRPGFIYKANNHIAIDCGCYLPDGRLSAICLDTLDEFYVEK